MKYQMLLGFIGSLLGLGDAPAAKADLDECP
jgi:hypothetical protein